MDISVINEYWGPMVGFILLVMTLSKLMSRVEVLEEKVKQLFSLWNDRNK